jgi:D5 N terminal like
METLARAVRRDSDESDANALDQAVVLAKLGVPVFVAYPDPDAPTGFRLPKGWQKFKADPRYVKAWEPGRALCAVTGHTFDVLDFDPRNGWPADVDVDLEWFLRYAPFAYATVVTPSGGFHAFVKRLGVGKGKWDRPGIDIQAGQADGQGRGFVFLPPTVRASKVTGKFLPYEWNTTITENDMAGYEGDWSGVGLAEAMREPVRRISRTRSTALDTSPWRDIPAALAKGRHNGVVSLAGSLRNRGVNYEEGLNLMRRDVWPIIDQDGHPYTEAEFEADIEDVFTRYEEGTPPSIAPDPSDAFLGAGEGLTDAQLSAEVARARLDGRYRWTSELGWLTWTGKQWLRTNEEDVFEVIRRFLLVQRKAAMESADRGGAEAAWRAVLQRGRIVAVGALARGIAGIRANGADFDQDPDLLNCLNGVVDLRTGKLLPHDPALLMTKCTGVNYQPGVVPTGMRPWKPFPRMSEIGSRSVTARRSPGTGHLTT